MYLDFCVHIYFWLKNLCQTDRNAERAAATDWKAGGRLLNSHFFLPCPQALLSLSVYPV